MTNRSKMRNPPPGARRAAIYARFSTDFQSDRSIEDQVGLCTSVAHRENLSVVATYSDRAKSGASIFGRDGLQKLNKDSKAGVFDVLIVEALDRLSRDMADLALIFRDFQFRNIELRAVHDGVADTVTIGLRGLVGQLFREDGAKKVRRGMAGVVREGRYAGGRAYGYMPTPGEPGKLRIVEAEAETVRRIFAEYAGGISPRDIAAGLNRDRIAPPRGDSWNASTINGNAERGTGIIQNSIYGGEIVWNKVRMIKDPSTGKRISRPNPRSEWQRCAAPELAIDRRCRLARGGARTKKRRASEGAKGPAPLYPLSALRAATVQLLRRRHGQARQLVRPAPHPLQPRR
ncbi:recombinase family protein [Rhodoblastus acidophilus]|uniref:Recombinase family protein n=1 Tax=Candidatus Rhodoblastus alkanivorans TaxID=2954117 RepID=A0ABS9Z3L6_9HYPH|nr:recombinase family protein [Candidatus Rhodoblastus alkanivorans]MCI4680220.1 recombinase family protein [Candidatus Rhodoblastus alkanivorans]MCI4682258.1 recombinase family protein [Candidatus Rhodoblastus alkanivorans]MDI4639560.1 recombinase family protein [Rhodoblastus acidophilus]